MASWLSVSSVCVPPLDGDIASWYILSVLGVGGLATRIVPGSLVSTLRDGTPVGRLLAVDDVALLELMFGTSAGVSLCSQ